MTPWKYFREVGPPCPGPDTGIEDGNFGDRSGRAEDQLPTTLSMSNLWGCVPDMPINDRILGAGTGDIDAECVVILRRHCTGHLANIYLVGDGAALWYRDTPRKS